MQTSWCQAALRNEGKDLSQSSGFADAATKKRGGYAHTCRLLPSYGPAANSTFCRRESHLHNVSRSQSTTYLLSKYQPQQDPENEEQHICQHLCKSQRKITWATMRMS